MAARHATRRHSSRQARRHLGDIAAVLALCSTLGGLAFVALLTTGGVL